MPPQKLKLREKNIALATSDLKQTDLNMMAHYPLLKVSFKSNKITKLVHNLYKTTKVSSKFFKKKSATHPHRKQFYLHLRQCMAWRI